MKHLLKENKRRVVVTGMSTVNPLGQDLDSFWTACKQGTSGIKKIEAFSVPDEMSQIAGIVEKLDISSLDLSPVQQVSHDRSLLFALKATTDALEQAGLGEGQRDVLDNSHCAVVVANAISQIGNMEKDFCNQTDSGKKPLSPAKKTGKAVPNSFFFDTMNAEITNYFGLNCGYVAVVTGCTGGLDSIGYALSAIRRGELDMAIAGASEAPITPLVVASFSKIGATSIRNHEPHAASRPFDTQRDGFVLAEGCGILILESLEHARARRATIYAEIGGFGSVNNCYHMTDIPDDGKSIARASLEAIQDADMRPDDIDFINAHGSSTPQNDVAEANAFRYIFGEERTKKIPVTSVKSQTGHTLAAATGIEVVTAVKTLQENIIPPTINLHEQDGRCKLNVVVKAQQAHVNCILKTSSGFSGIHSSLIIKRWADI